MKPIAININDEYKIKIETGNEFKDSIFEDVYNHASKKICDIISQSENSDEFDSYNNIIAFTGERGKGKSSSMVSFRNALLNYNDKNKHFSFFSTDENEVIRKHSFVEIDIIDPSLFKGSESLFEIVVAKMFSNFEKAIKEKNNNISDDQRREIIKLFQKVFDNMKIINNDKSDLYNLDSLEALSNLAYSSNLRSCFKDLVDIYLNVLKDKRSFLIVSIDDFDLNISKAYEMLEDIRHFLIQKRVILLIACKIEQLKDSIVNEIVKEYRYKLNLEQKNKIYSSMSVDERKNVRYDNRKISSNLEITNEFILAELLNKAEKYIEKLIPFNHQIFIPSLMEFCDITFSSYQDNDNIEFTFFETSNIVKNNMSVIYIGEQELLNNIFLNNLLEPKNEILKEKLLDDKKLFVEKNIYDCLLKLIYSKSNIFINKTEYRYHSIFPPTLRELNELIKVFNSNNENVLESFRKYILYKSINELPDNLKNIIIEIDKQDFSFLNSHIVNHLGNIKKIFQKTNNKELDTDFDVLNPSFTSIGDVFSKLKILYENVKTINTYWYKFLDYLSVYYSIRINQILKEKPTIFLEYCKGGLYNGEYQIFPEARIMINNRNKKISRDWIEYKLERKPGQSINSIFKSLDETNAYWLAFFIQYFGSPDSINEYNYPYFRKINQGGGVIYNLTFSPFSIFTNILFPLDVWYSIFNKDFNGDNVIMKDILKWKEKYSDTQLLLLNPIFYVELIESLSRFSSTAFKSSSIPNYFDTLYVYFNESLKKALNLMNKKYNYLTLDEDCFDSHPIKLQWDRINLNKEFKNKFIAIFDAIFKEEMIEGYTIGQLALINKILGDYSYYLKDNTQIKTTKFTNLMNKLKIFPRIHQELTKISSMMKKDKTGVNKYKTMGYDYLNDIVNGQSA